MTIDNSRITNYKFQTTNSDNRGIPRSCEFLMALGGLIVLSPVLVICALLVRLTSPGRILFCQNRVGRGGKLFKLRKFRTMHQSASGLPFTAATDSRITSAGKYLRHWKLDEFPELYNILLGEMSFVGPRPEVPELVDLSNPQWQKILEVRPGLTDPVTITLRNEESLLAAVENKEIFYREIIQPYKLSGYIKYIETKSFRIDFFIIIQTIKAVIGFTSR